MQEPDLRLLLTGAMPLALVVATGLAVPLSWWALRRYRAAVIAGMQVAGGGGSARLPASGEPPRPPALVSPGPLVLTEFVPGTSQRAPAGDAAAPPLARRGPWRAAAAYALGGGAYAAVMSAAIVLADDAVGASWVELLMLGAAYFWPAVLAVLFVAAYDLRRRLQVLAAYVAVAAAVAAVAAAVSAGAAPLGALLFSIVLLNAVPTVLVFAFSLRSLRAVGLFVLAALLLAALGAQGVIWLAASSESFLRAVVTLGHAAGLGAYGVLAAMLGAGVLAGAALARPLVRTLAARYAARRFSDQSLVVDAQFLVFGVAQSLGLAATAVGWFFAGLAAFAAYKGVSKLAMRALQRRPARAQALLLLRVFRLGPRSERLLDHLRRHWLHEGPVRMIAGPDLATTTVQPDEFLDFLGGRLDRRFVHDERELERRLAALRGGADPDGRHRVDSFLCRTDTWRPAMQALARGSAAVLMDLRSFSVAHAGCRYEIGQLLDRVPLTHVLFIVDGSTDRRFLEATLHELWRGLAADSPNRARGGGGGPPPTARLAHVAAPREAAMLGLCGALGRAGAAA